MTIMIDKNIFGLDITVDTEAMKMIESENLSRMDEEYRSTRRAD
jgi:hypothetical protein